MQTDAENGRSRKVKAQVGRLGRGNGGRKEGKHMKNSYAGRSGHKPARGPTPRGVNSGEERRGLEERRDSEEVGGGEGKERER